MLGSEHLSQLFYDEGPGGNNIGEEFADALRIAKAELGATHIRAHAILSAPIRLANDAIASSLKDASATLLSQLDSVSADAQGVRFAQARRKEDDEQHVY